MGRGVGGRHRNFCLYPEAEKLKIIIKIIVKNSLKITSGLQNWRLYMCHGALSFVGWKRELWGKSQRVECVDLLIGSFYGYDQPSHLSCPDLLSLPETLRPLTF